MNHLPYDAFNGSLVEQNLVYAVGNEESSYEVIKKITTGDMSNSDKDILKLLLHLIPLTP
jgi:hypothetical protein